MSDLSETVAELRRLSDEAASIIESLRARDRGDDLETRLTWRMQQTHRLTILRERLATGVHILLDALDELTTANQRLAADPIRLLGKSRRATGERGAVTDYSETESFWDDKR